ncbi:hypothetical protein BDW68DRAFT_153692 [Aspergillus falconensis]
MFTLHSDHLTFSDHIAIIQTARTFADGYDCKDANRLRDALADSVTAVLSNVSRNRTSVILGDMIQQSRRFDGTYQAI